MRNDILLHTLQKAVSEDEIFKLSNHILPHISEFNRSVILEMLQTKSLMREEISEEKVDALKNTLENYLQIYLSDQKDAWKWIILSCIYLCFICHRPLHSQEMAHYVISFQNNKPIYYLLNNFLYDKSIANAPSGAVNTIARTATVSTISPQEKSNASGIPPIAA